MVIIGAGEGISKATAELFGKQNYTICLIARKKDKLEKITNELRDKNIDAHYFIASVSDSDTIRDTFEQIWQLFPHIDILHFNVSKSKQVDIVSETSDSLTRDFKTNVASVMTCLQLVLPDMEKIGEGTILLTGGGLALHPNYELGSLSIGKAGLRNMAQSLHNSLKSKNIYVGTVTVCGFVAEDSPKHSPKIIAELFWKLHTERKDWEIIQ